MQKLSLIVSQLTRALNNKRIQVMKEQKKGISTLYKIEKILEIRFNIRG